MKANLSTRFKIQKAFAWKPCLRYYSPSLDQCSTAALTYQHQHHQNHNEVHGLKISKREIVCYVAGSYPSEEQFYDGGPWSLEIPCVFVTSLYTVDYTRRLEIWNVICGTFSHYMGVSQTDFIQGCHKDHKIWESFLTFLWYETQELAPRLKRTISPIEQIHISLLGNTSRAQATGLGARASRVKWPVQFMLHWYGISFTEYVFECHCFSYNYGQIPPYFVILDNNDDDNDNYNNDNDDN